VGHAGSRPGTRGGGSVVGRCQMYSPGVADRTVPATHPLLSSPDDEFFTTAHARPDSFLPAAVGHQQCTARTTCRDRLCRRLVGVGCDRAGPGHPCCHVHVLKTSNYVEASEGVRHFIRRCAVTFSEKKKTYSSALVPLLVLHNSLH